jgi:hypothetical protein
MRIKERLIVRTIAACLAAMLIVGVAGRGHLQAMLAPSTQDAGYNRAADERKVQSLLERRLIQQRLKDLGYHTSDIERRMSRLSDAQVHQVAMQVDKQVPAGDGGATWIIIGAVLLLILLIAAIDDDDDDDDDDHDRRDSRTDVDVESQPPAGNPPQTIIVK